MHVRLKGHKPQTGRWAAASLARVGLLPVFYFMVCFQPFQNVYFNLLAGRQIEHRFERDYWGLSYRQAIKYVAAHDGCDTVVVAANMRPYCKRNSYLLPDAARKRLWFALDGVAAISEPERLAQRYLNEKPDYYLTEYRSVKGSRPQTFRLDSVVYELGEELHSVEVEHFKIMGVYKVK